MPLLLATTVMEAATAKVPFSMIMLLDHQKRGAIPKELRLRMALPGEGLYSCSLWDAPDKEVLQAWLEDSLGDGCTTEVSEVQEDFTFGVAVELARARTSDRMAVSSKNTMNAIGEQSAKAGAYLTAATARTVHSAQIGLENFDRRTGVLSTAKDTTSAAVTQVSTAVNKAFENERVASVVGNVQAGVSTGWKKVGESLGFIGAAMRMNPAQQGRAQPYQAGPDPGTYFNTADPAHSATPTGEDREYGHVAGGGAAGGGGAFADGLFDDIVEPRHYGSGGALHEQQATPPSYETSAATPAPTPAPAPAPAAAPAPTLAPEATRSPPLSTARVETHTLFGDSDD